MKVLNIFKGDKGEWSSKRFVGVIGALVLFSAFVYNVIKPTEQQPSNELISAVVTVVVFCLGYTAIEKFAKNNAEG